MKRMNEVFLLPVRVGVDDSVVNDDGSYVGDLWTSDMAKLTAHAINNVDALADALEKLVPYCFGGSEESTSAWADAKDALNAYRGAK